MAYLPMLLSGLVQRCSMHRLSRQISTAFHNPKNAAGLAFHRIATRVAQQFAPLLRYRAFMPEAVNIYPTDRCNLNCAMCFEKLRDPRSELDPGDWLGIIDQLARFKPRIHLSGGEPLLYKGIDRIITRIKSHAMYLAITTNGTLLERYAATMIEQGVNAITVSIDGPPAVHDTIRGVAGSFEAIIRGLEIIRQHRRHSRHPSLRINSMLNAPDPSVMQEVIRIALTYNAEHIQFIHPMFATKQDLSAHRHFLKTELDRDLNYWQGAQEVSHAYPDIEQLHAVCADLKREKTITLEIFPDFTLPQMRHYYNTDGRFYDEIKGRCHAMWSTATLLPSGDIESCPDYIVGNCYSGSIKHAWNSTYMRALRKRIYNKRFFTVCRACCFFYL